jgi:hypothetical protein
VAAPALLLHDGLAPCFGLRRVRSFAHGRSADQEESGEQASP